MARSEHAVRERADQHHPRTRAFPQTPHGRKPAAALLDDFFFFTRRVSLDVHASRLLVGFSASQSTTGCGRSE